MRKVLFLSIITIFIILPAFSDPSVDTGVYDREYASVTFTVDDMVICGFSSKEVNDLLPVPSDILSLNDEEGVEDEVVFFDYDDTSRSYMTPTFFYYIQAFTTSKLTATISTSGNLVSESAGSSIPYSLVLSNTETGNDGVYNPNTTITILEEKGPEILDESGNVTGHGNSYSSGRPYSGGIYLQIPVYDTKNVDTTKTYSTVITLEVKPI